MEPMMPTVEAKSSPALTYIPTPKERDAQNEVIASFVRGQTVIQKSYNQFNGNTLYDMIDDWQKRWNGFVPPMNPLTDQQSNIFLNFTRKQIISFLASAAMQPPKAKIDAVNKKSGMHNRRFAELLNDLNKYSLREENGDARFLEVAMETRVKGTCIVYEGYCRSVQKDYESVGDDFDIETGKGKTKKERKVLFDNCFQKIHPVEDFYIMNPYETNLQKQPKIIPRTITTYSEGKMQYGHYPNWKYVKPGAYTVTTDVTTFYRNKLATDLAQDQVEILPMYDKPNNHLIVMINGIIMYDSVIPFKDGNYPYSRYINEPYGNDFFWGMGDPGKYMGEQDEINTLWNLMTDKTYSSLLPTGLSSDPDDLVEDDTLEANKIRKVGDVEKWKFITMPGVSAGEQAMLQTALSFAKENGGDIQGGAQGLTPRGGKLPAKQLLLKQQEAMKTMGFSMNFLEDGDRDRTELRIHHILQFYSIPKIEKITGSSGKEFKDLTYRDVQLTDQVLSDGKKGNKVIKLIGDEHKNPDERQKIADQLSVTEAMGEVNGIPTEAVAMSVDIFYDFNFSVQVVKNSSFARNAALDQAMRQEYAQWRIPLAMPPGPGMPASAPADVAKIVSWVEEAFDIDPDQFKVEQQQQQQMGVPGGPPGGPGGAITSQLGPGSEKKVTNMV